MALHGGRLRGRWATENTREALWDAMNSKEVYATSGTRVTVGLFAGWDFTVDVARATWTNTIGATELVGVRKDPAIDPTLRAYYYARVNEIPTPRWTA